MAQKISEALEIHRFMNEQNIIMSFIGELNHHVTTSLLKNLKNDLAVANVDLVTQKRLYGIIVECLDNLAKHWVAGDISRMIGKASPPIFILSKHDNFYYIITGNHIPNEQIDSLVKKIELVNSLNKKGLQDYYRKIISEDTSPIDRDNAGLGIIEIALKSGNKLEYEFRPVKPDVSFYMIQAKLSS